MWPAAEEEIENHFDENYYELDKKKYLFVQRGSEMNEKDFINLMRDIERHEDAVMEDAKEIRRLKVDVWELSNLVRLLAAFVPRPVSGMVEEKAAIEFETQLQAVLQKHGIES